MKDPQQGSETPPKRIYAIHTSTGYEDEIQKLIWAILPELGDEDHFVPQRLYYFKKRNRWYKEPRELFPGYIFIRSRDAEELFFQLKQVPGMTRLLQYDEEYGLFTSLDEEECAFIDLLCSVSLSEIRRREGIATRFIIPGSRVEIIPRSAARPGDITRPRNDPDELLRIVDGPLLKLNPYVSRIDFKTRSAILDKDICGNHKIHIGIRLPHDIMESKRLSK